MTSFEQMQLKNREVSILFMQQEHAKTLKDLHQEIEKLQKRCSDLQFQLAMEATYTSQEDVFREKCETLEKEVASQKKDLMEKAEVLQKKDIRIENLEQQIRAIEKKYKDELKQKQSVITRLQHNLEDKSDQIAKLQVAPLTARTIAHQGHHHSVDVPISKPTHTSGSFNTKVSSKHFVDQYLDQSSDLNVNPIPSDGLRVQGRSHRRRGGTPENTEHPRRLSSRESTDSSQNSSQCDGDEPTKPLRLKPMPPPLRSDLSESSSKSSAGSRRRRVITAQTTPNFPDVKHRPASARKLDSNSPDIETEEILRIARNQRKTVDFNPNAGKIIPPIKPSYDELSASQIVNPRKSTSAAFQRRAPKLNASEVEVETLAVDQVINKNLRKAQEFNSYGSDA